jgi:elongator complex protein 6
LIMSLRLLDTGTARDISGVIRIAAERELEEGEAGLNLDGKELLYFVGGDGNVKVFERGQ